MAEALTGISGPRPTHPLCVTMLYALRYATLYALCHHALCYAMLCYAMLYALCYALCYAMLCYAMLCSMLYSMLYALSHSIHSTLGRGMRPLALSLAGRAASRL